MLTVTDLLLHRGGKAVLHGISLCIEGRASELISDSRIVDAYLGA